VLAEDLNAPRSEYDESASVGQAPLFATLSNTLKLESLLPHRTFLASGRSSVPPTFRQSPTCKSSALAADEHAVDPPNTVNTAASTVAAGRVRTRVESATQTESLDEGAVALDIDLSDVLEQTTSPAHKQQQPPPRMVVMLVHLEVLGEVGDPLGQQRDLGFWRAGVGVMQAVLA
jgi:hypothetical protein